MEAEFLAVQTPKQPRGERTRSNDRIGSTFHWRELRESVKQMKYE